MNTDTIDFPPIIDVSRAEVATIPTATLRDTALASFIPIEQHMRTLAARFKDVAYDVTTPKGMKEAKAARMVLRDEGRYAVQRLQKRLKDEANDLKRTLDSKADELIAITMPVEAAIDGQITAEEVRKEAEREEKARIERERVAALEAQLAGLSVWIERCKAPGMTAERIALGIEALKAAEFVAADWAEFLPRALDRKAEVLDVMVELRVAAQIREDEVRRLEAQRLENERMAAEQKAEAERLAAERRALAEEAAALAAARAESERLERLAEERRAAQEAHERRMQQVVDSAKAMEQELIAARAAQGEADNPAPAVVPAEAACERTRQIDMARDRLWAENGIPTDPPDDYIPPSSTVDEPQPQTEAEMAAADGPEVDLLGDEPLPPEYLLAKLAMVMPLFQEARDALTAITEAQRKRHGISPTLAARMDAAGTYSIDDWNEAQ